MSKIYLGLLHIGKLQVGVVSLWVILLTLSLSVGILLFQLPVSLELGFFVFLMLLFGIPHGAADHIVYFTQSKQSTSFDLWMYFLRFYLGVMLVYVLAWWLLPLFSFIAFLLFSAYHFGQSQLYYLALPEKSLLKSLLYLLWGNIVLLGILGFNASETIQIMKETPFLYLMQSILYFFIPLLCSNLFALLFLFVWGYSRYKISLIVIFQELCLLALLLFLAWSTSILWSFAIYFALWHSLQTIEQEIKVFQSKSATPYNWKNYFLDVLPFSLISVIGIGAMLLILFFLKPSESYLLFGFFVIISILTAPHALLIEKIYQK